MLRFVLRRSLLVLPVLLGLLVLTFVLVRVVPSDPSAALAGQNATPQQVAEIRARYGFDRPLLVQFGYYLRQLVRGDLGTSLQSGRPVVREVLDRLPATLELTGASVVLAALIGIPLGVLAAAHRNGALDHTVRLLTVSGLAVAPFWLGIMLQLAFAMGLDVLPLRGRLGTATDVPAMVTGLYLVDSLLAGRLDVFVEAARHLVLPALTLGLGAMATVARFARSGMLETLHTEYVAYETAVGYPRAVLLGVYALRNSLVATVSQIGLLVGAQLAGAVVVEAIYDWPGIGGYAVAALFTSDYKAILAVTLLVGLVYAVLNIVVDVLHALIDPRVAEQL